ncbi:MAG: efflux RND transporter periplasmic adaptor subunit [Candidatus Latescibacteria bacterium]|nr:efflux RND transporter periplasmic adaptor subunit [Candidatus Latescibacterota bacterium]
MKKLVIFIMSTVIMFHTSGCNKNNSESIEAKSMEQLHKENGIPVKTEVVQPTYFETEYSYYSVLTGVEETTASSMVSDEVEKIHFKVGDRVTKDALVVTFPTDNPSANYYQSKVAFEHAETTLKRIKNLYENGGISLQEYDNTKTQFEVAKANWDAVRQTVTVKAPITGVLTNIAVRETDYVKSGDKLFTIAKTQKLKAWIWVSEHQIADMEVGGKATALWQDSTLSGKVVQVDMSLDTVKQAFGVVAEFDNPGYRVMSGVNAEVILHGKEATTSIVTPRKNVFNDGVSNYVFLAQNGVAVKREVTLGRSKGIDVEILQGVNPGDTLITEGQMLLKNDIKINIAN